MERLQALKLLVGELETKMKDAPGIEGEENKRTALKEFKYKIFYFDFNYAAVIEKYGHGDGNIREIKNDLKTIHDRCWLVEAIEA